MRMIYHDKKRPTFEPIDINIWPRCHDRLAHPLRRGWGTGAMGHEGQ